MRIAYTFENTGVTQGLPPVDVTAWIGGDLGSDLDAQLLNTSNGDTTLDSSDHWVISWDQNQGIFPDPILLHVPFGLGAGVIPVNTRALGDQTQPSHFDAIGYRYNFTLATNESKTLVWFVGLNRSLAEANTQAAQFNNSFDTMDPNLFNGLPPGTTVVNWTPAPIVAGPATPVPLNNPLGLFALAGLLGFIGWRRLRVRVEG